VASSGIKENSVFYERSLSQEKYNLLPKISNKITIYKIHNIQIKKKCFSKMAKLGGLG
jgi:hypothetical protein